MGCHWDVADPDKVILFRYSLTDLTDFMDDRAHRDDPGVQNYPRKQSHAPCN